MDKKYDMMALSVGEKYDGEIKGVGAGFETTGDMLFCTMVLDDISKIERKSVEKGIIKADLSFIDGVIFLSLTFGNCLCYTMPFNMGLYSEFRLSEFDDEDYIMPIILIDSNTRIIKAIRVIGFNADFSRKFYELSYCQWKNKILDYDKCINNILNLYSTADIIRKSVACQLFLGKYEMKYTKEKLIKRIGNGEIINLLFFYGHSQNLPECCLSQWYKCSFSLNGRTYSSAEQYMMAQKAMLFQDIETFKKIMATNDPRKCKEFGRQVKGFDEKVWDNMKYKIVLDANYLKFSQNEKLKNYLLSTKDKVLVEASPYDKVWGIGMAKDDINAIHPELWKGENLLGFALMETRDLIKN